MNADRYNLSSYAKSFANRTNDRKAPPEMLGGGSCSDELREEGGIQTQQSRNYELSASSTGRASMERP